MTPTVAAAATQGPVLAGLLAPTDADDVLRRAFPEAERRATTLIVLAAGAAATRVAEPDVREAVARWSEKYPGVPVTVTRRPVFDAAVALTAGTTGCALAVLAGPGDARTAAIVASVARRAHCPVAVLPYAAAGDRAEGGPR